MLAPLAFIALLSFFSPNAMATTPSAASICAAALAPESDTKVLMQAFVQLQHQVDDFILKGKNNTAEEKQAGLEAATTYLELAQAYAAGAQTQFTPSRLLRIPPDEQADFMNRYQAATNAYVKMSENLLKLLQKGDYDKALELKSSMFKAYTRAHTLF